MMQMFGLFKKTKQSKLIEVATINLSGKKAESILAYDTAWLSRTFEAIQHKTDLDLKCDILLLYADLATDGSVAGSPSGLREIIRNTGARIVLVASENSADNYIKAGAPRSYGRANLIMTLSRNGHSFGKFFEALFGQMKKGVSMPVAWNNLAPQVPGAQHDAPETIFACELGALTL